MLDLIYKWADGILFFILFLECIINELDIRLSIVVNENTVIVFVIVVEFVLVSMLSITSFQIICAYLISYKMNIYLHLLMIFNDIIKAGNLVWLNNMDILIFEDWHMQMNQRKFGMK